MNQIVPIQDLNSLNTLSSAGSNAAQSPSGLPFQSLFEDAVNNVKQTDASLNTEVYKMTTGQSDNLHDIYIASQKASLSVDLLVQMRNKVLDSYNEIMRMSV
ncbi:Flagellar hook-basal body complex protein FliE [Caprobacter fermentans]|uniref:Flagellar hook-basal body complex protein FliE n=1 Tax=Caproicibacter fermentans TaxID=2576756 RepID=A0A6N8HVI6_9FIRM|nr:flagellar hook-basal body complex protein FliE [Caproicibacter fermentans]MVB09732.1 Flagellar hook-basal body complex protein FliE [Caproicibacter fermentans]OCN03140.1 flagellar hook-basal body complex protein FliE [Clostridium sp. W14A]QNK42382.1 flagellar hook-basal body complex protein FliE [Caproicibacter fermentans]